MAVMAVMARDAKGPRNFQDGGLQNAVAFNNVTGKWTPTTTTSNTLRTEGMREFSLVPVNVRYNEASVASVASTLRAERDETMVAFNDVGRAAYASTIRAGGGEGYSTLVPAYAIQETASRENPNSGPNGKGWKEEEAYTLDTRPQNVAHNWRLRRITPTECERLQGFPDGYTQIGSTKDGPRYKALGNSMAVPVMHWLGKRICSAL